MKLIWLAVLSVGLLAGVGARAAAAQPEAATPGEAKSHARALVDRARGEYEQCRTFSVRVEGTRTILREGGRPESEVYWTSDVEFVRPGMIRVEDRLEINGANRTVAWGANKATKELVEAGALGDSEVGAWMGEQVWLHVHDALMRAVLGRNRHEFLIPELEEVREVRTEVIDGEVVRVVVGQGAKSGWKAKTGMVEVRLHFGEKDGLLREIAFEDAAMQRLQDQYKARGNAAPAKVIEAWDRVRFHSQVLNAPIADGRFDAPAGYTRVVLPSSPMGGSVLAAIGKTVHERQMAQIGGKPTVVMSFFMGAGVEYLPSMEWLHREIQPGAQVLSTRPRPETGLTYDAEKITHGAVSAVLGEVAGVSTERYAPMLFLIDGKNRLQAVFTGYMPVYTLRLRELAVKLSSGENLWPDEVLDGWRRGEVMEAR